MGDTPSMVTELGTLIQAYGNVITNIVGTQIPALLDLIAGEALLVIPMGVAFCGWCFGMLGRAIHKS